MNIKPFILCLFCGYLLLASYWAQAQLILSPNHSTYTAPDGRYAPRSTETPLSLPFFDDFSTTSRLPNPAHWLPNGGTYISNNISIAPPTLNVAVFDGADAQGQPYVFNNPLANGLADQLVSRPIDLSSIQASDDVFLSFYWQAFGLGEVPDGDDSIRLQFKDNADIWHTVWVQRGSGVTQDFAQVFIPLNNNPAYWHAQFQFRFQSFGRLSGPFDHWFVDYVYLDRNRSAIDIARLDVATVQAPTSLLRRYRAMPVRQFNARPTEELSAFVNTSLNNLNSFFNVINYRCTIEDTIAKSSPVEILNESVLINAGARNIAVQAPLSASLIPLNNNPKTLKTKFSVVTGDPALFTPNDSIVSFTTLGDYYAYDDGSAEYVVGVNQRLARVAYRFVLNTPDTLTAIQINIVPFERSLIGETFVLAVWSRLDNRPESLVSARSLPITYSNRDELTTYTLERPIPVQDTIFIGWQQTTDTRLTIGYDKNNDSGNDIFFFLDRNWQQNTELRGSLLLRPVFGEVNTPPITGFEPVSPPTDWRIYPNPSSGSLTVEGTDLPENLQLYSLDGQQKASFALPRDQGLHRLTLPRLPDGMYLLKGRNKQGRTMFEKLIIRH
ncbi:T9SS type A sorting domain-containing protein [Eisenibacter elegans]|uniref:T9SS type A sorting domain-containing protein n=1 Tax=Eisenibacter elegans TaxID=997 RepID=UPI0003F8D90F|nr:T9SS type A sorting domain-containing protein [Eisenibacter elegans]